MDRINVKNMTRKGKAKIALLSILCAVLLGCASFGFAGLFGADLTGLTNGGVTVASAATGDIGKGNVVLTTEETAAKNSAEGTKTKPYIITKASDWTEVVIAAKAKGVDTTVYAKLAANWTAQGGTFGAGRGFGTTYTVDGSGNLYIPDGANICLDLAGHNIDRRLTAAVANGQIIYIEGTFELTDSSTGDTALQGKITGGFNNTDERAGGIVVCNKATFKLSGGNIYANRCANTSTMCGGIAIHRTDTSFTMSGGRVENNVSNGVGGIYCYSGNSVAYITGGVITGNIGGNSWNAGGIRVTQLHMSGSPSIYGNITNATVNNGEAVPGTGIANDIKFTTSNNAKLIIDDALGEDAHIGVGTTDHPLPFTFTSGYGEHNPEGNSQHFFPNIQGQSIGVTEVGGKKELTITQAYDQDSWAEAIAYSVENKVSVKVVLTGDWTATGGSFGTNEEGGPEAYGSTGGLSVPAGADIIIDLAGHNINRNLTSGILSGNIFYVVGRLEITDSSTTDTEAQGKITGGFTKNMSGDACGGVFIAGGQFTLSGGNIYGNKAYASRYGTGAVIVTDASYFTMTGGRIENNVSNGVGGVYVWNASKGSTISGGTITGNTGGTTADQLGGGLRANLINLSGSPKIYNNVRGATVNATTCAVTPDTGTANDITFTAGGNIKINVTGKLEGAYMGVRRYDQGTNFVFTRNYGKYNSDSPSNYFFSNEENLGIEATGSGADMEAKFVAATTSGDTTNEIATAWSSAISSSLSTKKQVYFKLSANWTATSGSFGTGVGFGTFAGANSTATNGTTSGSGQLVVPVGANIVLDLNGKTINRGKVGGSMGHVIHVQGELEITDTSANRDGKITGGYSTGQGGGVALAGGVLRLTAGNITDNKAQGGGAVSLTGDGVKFYMTGGKITNNAGTSGAPAVYLRSATSSFYMSGGEISGNNFNGNGTAGAAVAATSGTAYISGGSIINNNSGKVGDCSGGIGALNGAIYISGNPVIKNNTDYEKTVACNVYLPSGRYILSNAAMTTGAEVGITVNGTVSASAQVKFTNGFSEKNTGTPLTYFFSDNTAYKVGAQVDVDADTLEGCIATTNHTYLSRTPTAASSGQSKNYDGNTITLVTGVNLGYMSLSGTTTATDVGNYNTTVKPASGCYWPDGTDGAITVTCTISPRDISTLADDVFVITLDSTKTYTYTGSAITPTIKSVTDKGVNSLYQSLNKTDHYTIKNASNTNASTSATVTLEGKGNYKGTKTITFTIKAADITATPGNVTKTYTGTEYVIAKTGTTVTSAQTLVGVSATTKGSQAYTYKFSTTITNGASGNWTSAATSYKITNVNATATTVYYQITASNHNAKYGSFTVKVNPVNITATVSNVTKTYTGTEYVVAKTGTTVTSTQELIGVSATTVNSQTYTYKFSTTITNDASGDWSGAATSYKITNVNSSATTVYYQITAPNHNAKYGSFTVKVNNATITGTVANQSWTYDGKTHQIINNAKAVTNNAYTKNGISLTVVNSQTQTWKFSTTTVSDWSTVTANNNLTFKNVADVGSTGKTVYYQVTAPNHAAKTGSFTVSISKKAITAITLEQSDVVSNKTYDGNTTGELKVTTGTAFTSAQVVSGDTVNIASASSIEFSDKNVATGKTVTIKGITLGGTSAGNYSIAATVAGTTKANITAKAITAITLAQSDVVNNKTYNSNKTGTLKNNATTGTAFTSDQVVSGDTVKIASASSIEFADKNVGTGKIVTVKGITLMGTDKDNYSIAATVAGTTKANITAKAITAISLAQSDVVNNKTYDGNKTGTLKNNATTGTAFTSDQVVSGDTVKIASASSIEFADKNVGTGKVVTVKGITLMGTDKDNYSIAATVAGTTKANITAKAITAITLAQSGVVDNKTYDGNKTGTLTTGPVYISSSDIVSGDNLTFSASSIEFSDKNVATGKTVTIKGITLGGTSAGNYSIAATVAGTTKADITAKAITAITLAQSDVVNNKTYDGNKTGTLKNNATTGTAFTSDQVVSGDTVKIASASSIEFDDKNVGTGKIVTVKGITLMGTDKDNYSIAADVAGTTKANITAKAITAISLAQSNVVNNKTYNSNTTGTLKNNATTGTAFTSDQIVSGDTVKIASASSIEFDDKNVGTGKIVTVKGITLMGTDKDNYSIAADVAGTTKANITAKALTATSTAANKTYDSDDTATVTLGTVTGIESGDDLAVTADGTFADKNVGTGKTVTIKYTLDGDDKNNYSMADITVTADITAKALTADSTVANKTYDGNKTSTVTLGTLTGKVDGDDLTVTPTGTFADENVGTGKNVTITYALTGDDAGNYSMADITVTADIEAYDITDETATVGAGADIADLTDVTYTGASQALKPVVKVKLTSAGDTTIAETTDYTLAYANSESDGNDDTTNVGVITVTVKGKGNYTGTRTLTYNINKATISAVEWNSGETLSKVYDGSAYKPVLTGITTDNNSDLDASAVPSDLSTMFGYTYLDSGEDLTTPCTEKDDYTVIAALQGDYARNFVFDTLKGDTDEDTKTTFKITLAALTGVSVTAYTGTYDGQGHDAITAKTANVAGGTDESNNLTWYYWWDENKSVTGWKNVTDANWSTTMPQLTNAGSAFRVFYKVTADNHEATGGSTSINISKKSITGAYSATSGNLNGSILPASLSSVPYTGDAYTEKDDLIIKVMLTASDEHTLENTETVTEYTLTFTNNIKAGQATITIAGAGNYSGSRTIKFNIDKADITVGTVTAYSDTYDGAAHDVVTAYNATLVNGDDDDTNTATWYFRIDGTEAWSTVDNMPQLTNATEGTKVFYKITAPNHNDIVGETCYETVIIDQKDISADYKLNDGNDLDDMKYTGSKLEPTFKVEQELTSGNWTELVDGDDFDFEYSGEHTEVGEVTVIVKGKGNYTGSVEITFNIIPDDGMTASANAYGGATGATYDGASHEAVIDQTVSATGGNDGNNVQWWYSLEDLDEDSTEWEEDVPELKNVTEGTTVYWKVTADNNSPVLGSVTVIISKATLTDASTAYNDVYDGDNHSITVSATGFHGEDDFDGTATVKYGLTDGTYDLNANPEIKDVADSTTVYYQITFDNYNTITGSKDLIITVKAITAIELATSGVVSDKTYDGNTTGELASTTGTAFTSDDVVDGDDVKILSASNINFADANAATGKTVTVKGITLDGDQSGNYSIAADVEGTTQAEIKALDITDETATVGNGASIADLTDVTYTGAEQTQKPVVKVQLTSAGETTLAETTEYTLDYDNDVFGADDTTNAGTITVTVTGTGNYKGERTLTYVINKATISAATWNSGETLSKVYDGSAYQPVLTGITTDNNSDLDASAVPSNLSTMFGYTYLDSEENISGCTEKDTYIVIAALQGDYALNFKFNSTLEGETDEDTTTTFEITSATLSATVTAYSDTYDRGAHAAFTAKEATLAAGTEESNNLTWWYWYDANDEVTDWTKVADTDWSETMPSFTDAKSYTVFYKVTADNHAATGGYASVSIGQKSISNTGSTLPASLSSVPYTGNAYTDKEDLTIKVTYGSNQYTLKNTETVTEYELAFSNNIKASTDTTKATITITGKGNYTGTKTITFVIDKADITVGTVTAYSDTYDGEAHDVISAYNATLVNGDDDDTNTATWYFRIDGTSEWSTVDNMPQLTNATEGTKVFYKITAPNHNDIVGETCYETVIIDQKDISADYKLNDGNDLDDMKYTGSKLEPTFKVEQELTSGNWTELVDGDDFDFEYSGEHTEVGEVTVTVKGKGNYTGSVEITFNIIPDDGMTASANAYGGATGATYDGASHEAVIDQTVSATGGNDGNNVKWWYSLEDLDEDSTEWEEDVPELKNVTEGTTVYWKVTADNNSPVLGSVTVIITPKQITAVSGIAADGKAYDGLTYYLSGDNGSVKTNGDPASVQLGDAINSNLTGYVSGAVDSDGNTKEDDLKIVWADGVTDEQKGTFDSKNTGSNCTVTVPCASLALGGDDKDNYELVLTEDIVIENVEISARVVEISWTGLEQDWDDNKELKPTATVSNLVSGDTITTIIKITQNGTVVTSKAPGDYHVEVTGLNGNTLGNYTLTGAKDIEKTFTITTKGVIVYWNTDGIVYDGTAKMPKIYYETTVEGEKKEVILTEDELEDGTSFVITDSTGKVVDEAVNVGTYKVKLTLDVNHIWDGDLNGTQKTKEITFSIAKAKVEGIKLEGNTVTYNGDPHTLTVDWSEATLNGEAITAMPDGVTATVYYNGVASEGVTNAGNYKVTVKFTVNGNFEAIASIEDVDLIVEKAEIPLTGIVLEDKTVTFTGSVFTITVDETKLDEKVSVSYAYTQGEKDYGTDGVSAVGEYDVTATFAFVNAADKDNYFITINGEEKTTLTATLTINKEAASVSDVVFENSLNEKYDGNVHRLTVSGAAIGVKSVSYEYATDNEFTNVVSTDGVKDAGTYYVRATFTVDDNYAPVDPEVRTLVIAQTALTVKANDKTITYGDNPATAAYTATFEGLVGTDTESSIGTVTFTVNGYTTYGDVGIYENAIRVSGPASTTNYTISYENGDLTVKPYEVTVKWYNDSSKTSQDMTYTYDGIEHRPYAEVSNAIPGRPVTVTVEGGKVDAGMNYEAKIKELSNSNYALPESGLTVTFDILPANPKSGKIIWDYTTLYYNGKEQAPKAYFFENENDNVPKELKVTVNKTAINAGEYTATVLLDGSYTLTGETQLTFKIEKRTVHVVIDDYTTIYTGSVDFSGATWSYASGSLEFVSTENYTIDFSCGTIEGPDTYPLFATFNSVNSANYEVIFSGSWSKAGDTDNNGKCGTLTITSAKYDMSKISFTGAEVTYDGNAHVLGVSGLPAGVTVSSVSYMLDGWNLGSDGATAAGVYKAIVKFSGSEYYEAISDIETTLTIKRAALSVKANDKTIVYGDAASYNGVVYIINGTNYSAEDAKLAGELTGTLTLGLEAGYNGNAGKYKIIPAGLEAANYVITFVPGTLTVSPREITVTWYSDNTASSTNLNYNYDGNKHTPYPVASGLLGTDKIEFSVDGGKTEAGLNYTATITEVSNGNYTVSAATSSVKFSIVQKGVIIWDNTPIYYVKDTEQAPTAWYYNEDTESLEELTVTVTGSHEEAGEYTATVTDTLPAYISDANKTITYEILPQEIEITIGNAADLVYGAVEGADNLEKVLSDLLASLGFEGDLTKLTLVCNVDNSTAVGTYTITGTCTDKNYNVTFVPGSLTIVKAEVVDNGTLDAFNDKNETVTYDGKAHTVEVSGDLPDGVTGVTYKYYSEKLGKYVTESEVVNAGTYTVEAIFTVDGNHEEVGGTYVATLTIEQAELTVKFDKEAYEFDYDGKEHSAKVTGDLTGIKKVTYLYNGVELSGVKNADTYTVTVEIEVTDADNYKTVTVDSVQLIINKVELTVTANNGSVVYGTDVDTIENFGYTLTGLAASDASVVDDILGTVSYSYETVTGAGVYDITISGNTSSDNYSKINYVPGKLTVTPYTLTASNVQWTDKEGGEPATDGKFVYTYTAGTVQQPYAVATGVNGETVTLVVEGGQINAGYGYQAQVVSISGKNANNYMLPAEGLNITFDILPAPVTGTIIWDNSPLYYDGTNRQPKAYYFLEEGGERIELPVTVEGDSKNVGKYVATVNTSGIGVELSGDKSKEFSVVARKVYVEIGNLDVQYGETPNMSAVSWSYADTSKDDETKQFLAGEAFSITFSCGVTGEAGTYPISAQFICDNAENYQVVFSGNWASAGADNGKYGTLTIFKASYDMSKVTVVGTSVTYDGKLHTVSVIGLPEGVEVASVVYEKDGFGYDANGVKNVGTYTVTVKFSGDENYGDIDDLTATLTIKKAALTIKANDKTIVYGEHPSASGVTYSGFAQDDAGNDLNDLKGVLSYTYGYVFGGNVGKYDIVPTGFTSENYEITYKVGTLTVVPRTITITWYDDETIGSQNFVYTYDEQSHAPYAVAGNLVEGDSLTLTVTGETDLPGLNFVASVGELTNANYKLPNDETVNQTFSIMPAPARSIVWDNAPIYYNGTNLKPKAYYVEDDGSWTEITEVRVYVSGVLQSNYKNVGLYTATVIYKGVTSSLAYNILPVIVTVEIQQDAEIVYGNLPDMSKIEWKYADGSNEFIASDMTDGVPVSFRCPTVNANSSVGKYEILGSCTNANYSVTFVSGTLTIVKASYDISGVVYGDLTATYDGEAHTISVSNLPAGVTATVSYEKNGKTYGANGVVDAGEYKAIVSFTVEDTVNYNSIGDVEKTLTIEKKAADVTGIIFHSTTKHVTYNGKVQEMYVSGTAIGVSGVKYTYYKEDRVTEIEGGVKNAGTYRVKAEFTFDPNYSGDGIDEMWATLVIKQAKLTVTASDGSVVYGEPAAVNGYGYTVTGLIGSDSEEEILGTLAISFDSYSDAKVYANAIIISGNETSTNYEIEYVYGTLTVTPREITVTWYDEKDGTEGTEFEYEYEEGKYYIPYAEAGNLVGSDELELEVIVKREGAGDNYVATVQAPTNGNYALPAGGITVNFTIKYSEEDLDEHKYELVWDNDTLYYNKDSQKPSAKYYDGTQWIDVTDDLVIKDISGNTVDAVNVGDYTAEYVYVPSDEDDTTTFSNVSFSFSIAPRKVYITIGDMQVKFGETPDMSKVSWKYADGSEQFIAGDVYTLTFSVEEITSAKKYPIAGALSGNANYEVIFTGASWATAGADNGAYGTLTVNKATYDMSRVTFTGTDVTYNGTVYKITVNGTPAGVTVTSVSYTRSGWNYNGGVTNAGTYTVTVSFEGDENHEAIADMTTTLTVKKAALTVTANDNTIVYGDAPTANGVTYAGLAESDTDENGEPKASVFGTGITYEYNYLKGGKVGDYHITPKGLTAENYVITYGTGTLTVTKRTVTVAWYNDERMNSQTMTYKVDGNVHLPYAEAGNVVAGDSVVLTVDSSCAQSQAGINYLAKIVAISNSNYALPENTTVYFEIIPDAYVVVWESTPFVYNGEPQAPKAYYYTANGERVSLRVTVLEGEAINAGVTYHASASLITGNVELTGELTNHEFTIAKREVTVIINDATSAYGEEIVLAGWRYAEGSAHFAHGEHFYILPPATSSSTVGEYVITGRCTDNDNYVVTVVDAKYTITKALLTAPEIASKVYTGELQIADITASGQYVVILNDGGKDVGTYRVMLLLTDYSNCKWADTNNQYYYLEFVITPAENEWTTEFEVHGSVVAGSGEIYATVPEAKFGNSADVVIKYYTDENCTKEVSKDYIVTDAASGTYYAKVTLAGTDNYNEISSVYSFSVTGSLAISIIWTNTTLTYNGNVQTPEAYIWLGNEQVMLIVTGGQKDAGTYEAQTSLKAVDGRDLSGYEIPDSDSATKVEYTINARSITISIDDDATSVYGSAVIDLSRLNWTRTQGSIMSGDELGITFRCAVTDVEFAEAGVYPIIGECANGNYNVTFVGSWSGDDEYNGTAATYTVRKATITVSKSESTWVDEEGLLEGNQNYFVYLDQKDEDGNYKYITTKGGQEATVYYSTNIDKYTSVHDSMTETEIAQMFADGGSSSAPEIKQVGNFVIYYRIEAENHEVKYGIWKVLIQPKDRYIMITFTKPYQVTYGESVEGQDLIDELIDGGYIEVSGRINNLETLREIAKAYAYEDVGSDGFVNGLTDVSKYSIRLVFTDLAANSDDYKNIEFRYSTSNKPNSDTNFDKYEILQRPIIFGWTETSAIYDGELHLPSAKITGLVGGEEYVLTGLQLGTNVVTLANDDIINVTVELLGSGDLTTVGSYQLRLTIDNGNYKITQNSDLVTVSVTQKEVSITWDKTSFEYDGERHIPEATVTIGDEVFTLKDIVVGAPIAIELANGDIVNVTLSLVGTSDMATGDYDLSVSVDNANYKLSADSQSVKVSISGYEEPFKFVLPEWGIYALAGTGLFLLLLIIILSVVLKKRKPAGTFIDEDGFSDPVGEDD